MFDLVIGQLDVQRRDRISKVVRLCRPDDRGRDHNEVLPIVGEVMSDMASTTLKFFSLPPEVRSRLLGQIDVTARAADFAAKVKGIGPDVAQRVTE